MIADTNENTMKTLKDPKSSTRKPLPSRPKPDAALAATRVYRDFVAGTPMCWAETTKKARQLYCTRHHMSIVMIA